jgi:hypothetical protein
LGWISIVIWAVILYVAGAVVSIIMDDFFRKVNLRFMTRNLPSTIFWGAMSFAWIVFVAELALLWRNRQFSAGLDERMDSLWFSYISLLTVGLGDFYVDPEYMFFSDLFIWMFVFLIGFTFLSSFLNQMGDLFKAYFPDGGEHMKERLRNTNIVGLQAVHFKKKNQQALHNIHQLVEKMDDDNSQELVQRAARIRQKKELLIHLIYQTQEELDYFTKHGEQYEKPPIDRVCEEENMLSEILEKTSLEREKLECYRVGDPIADGADVKITGPNDKLGR